MTYLSSTEVACYRPALRRPFRGRSYVAVSLDGQVYSQTLVAYTVVGDDTALEVPAGPGTEALPASASTRFPPIDVYVVDAAQHRVLAYAAEAYRITAALAPVARAADRALPLRNASVVTAAGAAALRGLTVASPPAGQYVLTLRAPALAPVALAVFIRGGDPAALYLISEPSPVAENVGPLQQQPVLGLKDSAGNVVEAQELQV